MLASAGRPSIAMATFVRLMVVKQRTGWGYETLVREVSDSLHLRRFCLIAIDQRVPDESTVRKLARRLGAEVVEEITRMVIEKAQRETRFAARAARIDSTVVEADIRYPSDAMLALQGARALAREGAQARSAGRPARCGCATARGRSAGRVRAISRTLARRTGEAKAAGDGAQRAGRPADRPLRPEAMRLAAAATSRQPAVAAPAPSCGPPSSSSSSPTAARKVAEQIDRRVRGLQDHRPARVDRRPRRPADPQGQARQADRVRLRRADLRGDREHPPGRARVHPPGRPRARQPGREHAAATDRRRAEPSEPAPAARLHPGNHSQPDSAVSIPGRPFRFRRLPGASNQEVLVRRPGATLQRRSRDYRPHQQSGRLAGNETAAGRARAVVEVVRRTT